MRLPFDFGFFSRDNRLSWSDVQKGADIINKYLTRFVYQKWGRYNECRPFKKQSDLPIHFAPLIAQDGLDVSGALGYHTTEHGQPVAYIDTQGGDLRATLITGTHEAGETNADPYGNALIAAPHPLNPSQIVRYLKEICDPPEAITFKIDGFDVSDFIFPEWYDKTKTAIPYSMANSIPNPTSILKGGYASFIDAAGKGWQITWFRGDKPIIEGPFQWSTREGKSIREQVDEQTRISKAQEAE